MAARPRLFACLVLFVVLLLPMVKAGWLCGHLVGEDGTGCFLILFGLWCTHLLSVVVCWFFLLVSLVEYVVWLFIDIFCIPGGTRNVEKTSI